ncbi:MAG: MerR family transcriptional regulator [Deltaproteobacteria bacterium]|jgi:DNA-binding transcriptional MerR regulator|nr:MerR family transcriptional regulator [Deltaproteobacteria bacterium]
MAKAPNDGQLLFRTGEIAEKLDLPSSIVRYWEKEFAKHIKPIRMDSGRKLYRKDDLEIFAEIKRLTRIERLTVEGAKLRIAQAKKTGRSRVSAGRPLRAAPGAAGGADDASAPAALPEPSAGPEEGFGDGSGAGERRGPKAPPAGKRTAKPAPSPAVAFAAPPAPPSSSGRAAPAGPAADEAALRKLIAEVRQELFGLRDYMMLAPDFRRNRGPRPRPALRACGGAKKA